MISNIASLLQKLMATEALKIAQQGITHAPTIGAMYEGLTQDILDRAIPSSLPLEIVNGFIQGIDGKLSTQIDCMLVTGSGQRLPYTDSYVWHIRDVIAVFEVKKNLFGRELNDAFEKQCAIRGMFNDYLRNQSDRRPISLRPVFRAFMQITGLHVSDYSDGDRLGHDLHRFIFHLLVTELVSPVRIIFGFDGYVDEHSLRSSVVSLLEKSADGEMFYTPFTLPTLVVCRSNSILKMSGFPYLARMDELGWHILTSNCENPLRLIIELIWTALENRFEVRFIQDRNLKQERLAPLVRANITARGDDKFSWIYEIIDIQKDHLLRLQTQEWSPDEFSYEEVIIATLAYEDGSVDIRDGDLIDYIGKLGKDLKVVVHNLVNNRLLAWDGEYIARPIHDEIGVIYNPNGRVYTSANMNLASEWLMQTLSTEQ